MFGKRGLRSESIMAKAAYFTSIIYSGNRSPLYGRH